MRRPQKVRERRVRGHSCQSRQIIVTASFLFLLILSPVGSQDPTTTPRPGPRIFTRPIRPPRYPRIPPLPTPTPSATPIPLKVSPLSVEVGDPVSFEVVFNPQPGLNIDYSFVFGDDRPSGWIKERQTTHSYQSANTYTAYADIRTTGIRDRPFTTIRTVEQTVEVKDKVNQQSPTITPSPTATPSLTPPPTATPPITPTPTVTASIVPPPTATPITPPSPSSIPWNYVIPIAFVVAIIGYLLHRKPKLKATAARPTFHSRWDQDTPQKQQENVSINYELHFDPNFSKGRHRLDTGGASLIKSRKKKP